MRYLCHYWGTGMGTNQTGGKHEIWSLGYGETLSELRSKSVWFTLPVTTKIVSSGIQTHDLLFTNHTF